jgi:hypothetical protein
MGEVARGTTVGEIGRFALHRSLDVAAESETASLVR